MSDKQMKIVFACMVLFCTLALVIGVKISTPPQPVTNQDGSISSVDQEVEPAPVLLLSISESVFMIAYERKGAKAEYITAKFGMTNGAFSVTRIPDPGETKINPMPAGYNPTALVAGNAKGTFVISGVGYPEQKQVIVRTTPHATSSETQTFNYGCLITNIIKENERTLVIATLNDNTSTQRSMHDIELNNMKLIALRTQGTLTRMRQLFDQGKLMGTCFTEIRDHPSRNYVYYKPAQVNEFIVLPVQIFPQSTASLGKTLYAFGLDKDRNFRMLSFEVTKQGVKAGQETMLQMAKRPNSIGVGHAFVHPHPGSADPMVSLLLWDDPNLRRFNAVTGAELSHTPLTLFTAGKGSAHRPRQSIELRHKDRHSAFTIDSLDAQGKPVASLVIGHSNTWKTFSVQGISNGLTSNGRWVAWDVRHSENNSDQVLFLDLNSEMEGFSGNLVLGQSNPGTEIPSFLAINSR